MKKLVCAAAAALAMAGTAFAAPITFTFTSVAADTTTSGNTPVDLVITLTGDTTNYVAAPTGPFGSSRYIGLGGTVSSVALGLSSVALASPLDLLINLTDPANTFPSFVGISDGVGIAGLLAHPNTVGDLIVNWDRVSNFSATQMANLSNGVTLSLVGGGTVGLSRLDSDFGPGQDGGFSATLVTTPGTVPEPTAPALVMMALAASALVTRRRRAG